MEIAEHIDALRRQGDLLADAAQRAGLDAPVPPCSPWLVKDLLRHTGYIHRWAARHITECPEQVLDGPPEEEILRGGAADEDLLAWFRAGHAALVQTLSTAKPGLRCATFMDAPSPLAFWARRQAHETAIHRADAESALGGRPGYPPDFAADGIDELIMGFGQRRKYRPSAGHEGSLDVRAADTGHAWHIAAEGGRIQARREPGGSDSRSSAHGSVAGPASGLYLFLWNRSDAAQAGITIAGDPGFLAHWQSSVRVRWG
ncbi:MAG TPA: maleylpyruvate isomerase family mycothiol-dependent enzyme [Streptosporangiaceae bacterium]|nr:maleylpyruvate isomerase family mycothiol-dependent enzyme [Streptosporangiaceae bacterium]